MGTLKGSAVWYPRCLLAFERDLLWIRDHDTMLHTSNEGCYHHRQLLDTAASMACSPLDSSPSKFTLYFSSELKLALTTVYQNRCQSFRGHIVFRYVDLVQLQDTSGPLGSPSSLPAVPQLSPYLGQDLLSQCQCPVVGSITLLILSHSVIDQSQLLGLHPIQSPACEDELLC